MEAPGLKRQERKDSEADAERAARGDMEAFERLYRAHAARIHSLARRLMGESSADDATQEIFIRAWRYLASYRGEAAFGTWLSRLGINLLLDRRMKHVASLEGLEQLRPVRNRITQRSVAAIDCDRALQRLPDGAREVLVLHDVEGYTHGEIAGMLGMTVGTSKSQLHRARALLRNLLGSPTRAAGRRGEEES